MRIAAPPTSPVRAARLPWAAAPWLVLLALAVPPAVAPDVARADEVLRVTCRAARRVVFVGNVARSDVAGATASVLADFPSALCVSLGAEREPAPVGLPGSVGADGGAPAGGITTGASGLDTALRALRGDPIVVAPPVAAAPPVTAAPPAAPVPPLEPKVELRAVNYPALLPSSPGSVRLAVYGRGTADDALAEWDRAVAADPAAFSALTPEIAEGEGYVMLSAGPVGTDGRAPLCLAAAAQGLDCRPGARARDDGPTLDAFLAEAGAEAAPGAAPASSPRRDPTELEAEAGAPGSVASGMACWPSALARDAEGPTVMAPVTAPVTVASGAAAPAPVRVARPGVPVPGRDGSGGRRSRARGRGAARVAGR